MIYSKLLLAKLCLFVFGATFAASNWKFVSICSCFIKSNERSEYSYVSLADFFFRKKTYNLFTLNFDFSRLTCYLFLSSVLFC